MIQISYYCPVQHWQTTWRDGRLLMGHAPQQTAEGFCQLQDPFLADQQIAIEYVAEKKTALIHCLGRALILESGRRIYRGNQLEVALPTKISIGQSVFELRYVSSEKRETDALSLLDYDHPEALSRLEKQRAPSTNQLRLWFEAITDFQKTVAGTQEFFLNAAKCVIDPGGMDVAMVVQKHDGRLEISSSYVPCPEMGISFDASIVERVFETGKTCFHDASKIEKSKAPEHGEFVVAAPVVDHSNQVTAVIYGIRSTRRANNRVGIRAMEAHFVHLIAESVSAGLSRLESESKAAQNRALLEQAFAPSVAKILQRDPGILEAQDRLVTVLFADIRGFSSIAEEQGTRVTYQLLADLMDCFTDIIVKHDGVILDYYGDGFSAFWNAPMENQRHATLACDAGFEMLAEMWPINERWNTRLGKNLAIGVGVSSGLAQVGNSGSRKRLKYGPRGSVVNLASRIEQETKRIGIPILISKATADLLDDSYHVRRVFKSQVKGFAQGIDLYQPTSADNSVRREERRFASYEKALEAFEAQDFVVALQILLELESRNQIDRAGEFLLQEISRIQTETNTSIKAQLQENRQSDRAKPRD